MIIKGLSKLTLLDYPERVACTMFTGGCNMRCPFCHNASLVLRAGEIDTISEEEIFSFLKKRNGVLDGVCITGGEPMLSADLEDFIGKIKSLGYAVKLDTNGTFPERLRAMIDAGLVDKVAVDIKNSPEKYAMTVGITDFDVTPIMKTVDLLREEKVDYELRTTVVAELHEVRDFESIGRWIAGAKAYYLQSFVDSGDTIKSGFSSPSKKLLKACQSVVKQYVENTHIRGT